MRRLRILVLMHPDCVPPDSTDGYTAREINGWKTEFDVVSTLRAVGHDVRPLGVQEEIKPVREEIESFKPHVVYTLLEEFHYASAFDQHIASYLELMKIPYTGCNPRGLILARGKDLSKTLVHHRRIAVPAFAVFPMRRKVNRPSRLALPLIVKSLSEDGSFGISQASIVDTDEKLVERVAFVHDRLGTAAIAEQYIEGRELYVGVLGNNRLRVLPVWEIRQLGRSGGTADRHGKGQTRSRLSGTRRNRGRAGQRPRAGGMRPHSANGETHIPNTGARWICAYRLSPLCRRHSIFH
jgi:D-alanine-D-alanine ligase